MRIRVKDVLDMLAGGATEAEILKDYPYLEPEDIRASLEYAAAYRGALDANVRSAPSRQRRIEHFALSIVNCVFS
jgi:uncharacterized protein (DUF433 family)